MRTRIRLTTLVLAALLAAQAAQAEPIGPYVYLVPSGGYTIFDRDMRAPNDHPLTNHFSVGGCLGFQAWRWLGIEAAGSFTPTSEDAALGRDVDFMQGTGNLAITPWSGSYGGPFLLLGGGASRLTQPASGRRVNQLNAAAGAGLQLWLSDMVGVRIEARDLMWLPKDDLTKPKSHTLALDAGLSFALGATPRDTDGDGVADRKDKCPDTPKGAHVDANGCPIDADGDGVFDGLDQCPDTPRGCTVDVKGCPQDADGDGVCDGLDQCADTPRGATADAKGCPQDSDGDGVFDGLDQCPDTPRGCTADAKGCPQDSDGDSVCDGLDKCPDTASGLRVDKDGCPIEVTERETEMLDTGMIRLQDINFETGKADLLPESMPSLDIVGQVLTKWPDLRIEIGGHTDSRGSVSYNQKLSEARVNSVLDYLIEKFPALKREQFTAVGYGESKPLAPNTNALNMAKNRRVEFKVLNTEVLKREVERRKLLKND
jgi:outer membrane protein OmpA-like peptidoglycan-associated protein/opacity protein-like surface antigen